MLKPQRSESAKSWGVQLEARSVQVSACFPAIVPPQCLVGVFGIVTPFTILLPIISSDNGIHFTLLILV